MKTLKLHFLAGLALAGSLSASAEISAQAWLETYYLDPQPAELPRAIRRLSAAGYFDRPEHVSVAIGFIATIFARHPDQVAGWLEQFDGLPESHCRLVVGALWQSGHPSGPDLLRAFGRRTTMRKEIDRLADQPSRPVADTPVRSPSSMRLQWGAFLATGEERHVVRILDAFGQNVPGLTPAVRISLAENAAAHPRVLEICRAQLDRQPEAVRAELRAALSDVPGAVPRS